MEYVIEVEGMTCGHCKARVEEAIEAVEGVEHYAVELENNSAKVQVKEGVEKQQIIDAINETSIYKAN